MAISFATRGNMENSGNQIFNANGTLVSCAKNKGCHPQKMCDPTNTVAKTPTDDVIIALGKKAIGWK